MLIGFNTNIKVLLSVIFNNNDWHLKCDFNGNKMCEILKMEICKLIFWLTALLFLNVFKSKLQFWVKMYVNRFSFNLIYQNEGVNKSTNNKQIYSSS